MRGLILSSSLLAGCNAFFGLEAPLRSDARAEDSTGDVGSDADVVNPTDDAPMIDAAVDAMPDALVCAAEFGVIAGSSSRYFIGTNNRSWAAAEADCEQRGAHLVVIGTDAERLAVHNAQGPVSWIGMTDFVTTHSFIWLTNEDTGGYPPPTGDPPWAFDSSQYSGHCVALGVAGTWGNIDCTLSREYICECDGYDADPARY